MTIEVVTLQIIAAAGSGKVEVILGPHTELLESLRTNEDRVAEHRCHHDQQRSVVDLVARYD